MTEIQHTFLVSETKKMSLLWYLDHLLRFDCQAFLKSGADVNEADEDGCTALMHAARFGHSDCLTLLLTEGATANALDKKGVDALYYASVSNSPDCVQLLIEAGADVNNPHKDGGRAIHYAVANGHEIMFRSTVKDWS